MPEWLKGTDCKSVGASLRWFESTPAQCKSDDNCCYCPIYFFVRGLDENHDLWFEREAAECEGLFFGRNEVSEKKNRRPVKRERARQVPPSTLTFLEPSKFGSILVFKNFLRVISTILINCLNALLFLQDFQQLQHCLVYLL